MRNLKRMREYIKEALFFSEHLRPNLEKTRLDVLVRDEVDLAMQNKRKSKNIRYTVESVGEPTVEIDRVLIRRLLTNLISNAVDASPDGSTIEIGIFPLVKTDPGRDWFRVRVTDHGSGIKQEHLERIFQPYFTTKKTGDDDRGFGLGLAISRKIASLHGGTLMVTSEPGRGTVMTLDLPSQQQGLHSPFLKQHTPEPQRQPAAV
jgi:signal transduction histidine kinase